MRKRATIVTGSVPLGRQPLSALARAINRYQDRVTRLRELRRPANRRPDPDSGTVTAFSDWVFRQQNPQYTQPMNGSGSTIMRWVGGYSHEQIERLRLWLVNDPRIERFVRSGTWRLTYADRDHAPRSNLRASRLCIGDRALGGRPDVVLSNAENGGIIIVERKVTIRDPWTIPRHGYANHWCQLWCYGLMDEWARAPFVLLALQYWHRNWERSPLAKLAFLPTPRIAQSPAFHEWGLGWFSRYGGRCRP